MCQPMNTTLTRTVPTNTAMMNNTINNTLSRRKAPKKSVRFNQLVHVAPFERASSTEAKDIWFTTSDLAGFKAQGREMAASYRKLGVMLEHPSTYRGFESCTVTRRRQRILSNRCVIYAHKKGMDDVTTAAVYKKCNAWSGEVAFVQAIHDYVDIYHNNHVMNNNNNCMDEVTLARAATLSMIPPVASMVPPSTLPFAIQSALVLQQTKRRNFSSSESAAAATTATATARRVRHRVC